MLNPNLDMFIKMPRLSPGCYVPCKDPPAEEVAPEKTLSGSGTTYTSQCSGSEQFIFLHN